ncbi:MAG TPA: Hsp20/alpha crystallin family protein [Pseudomonadales bacterium]
MNLEKLKPWNWFKHEEQSGTQIPVTKKSAMALDRPLSDSLPLSSSSAGTSLLQLHNEMNHLFDNMWRSFGLTSNSNTLRPPSLLHQEALDNSWLGNYRANLDVSGDDNGYEVSIDLPGLSESDIHIDVTGNTLSIRGEKEETAENKEKHYYRIERRFGSFQRTLSLPDDADQEEISATMKNGVLQICIPRKSLSSDDVRRISISS